MSKRFCLIEGCVSELSERCVSDICKTCKQGLRYWDKRDHTEVLERRRKLTMYQSRMATVGGKRRPSVRAAARSSRTAQAHASH